MVGAVASPASDFRLLGDLESIIDFDAEVPYRRFKLGVSEEQLHSAKVLGAPIDQRRLRPSHRVRAVVGAVQAQVVNPMLEDPRVPPGSEMRRVMEPAGEEEGFRPQPGKLDPRLQSVPGGCRDLELHGALGLVLHDSRARRDLVSMTDISDLEGDEIASAKLAVDTQVKERDCRSNPLQGAIEMPHCFGQILRRELAWVILPEVLEDGLIAAPEEATQELLCQCRVDWLSIKNFLFEEWPLFVAEYVRIS